MAYADDAVKGKLSALNETQEGIVGVAQWILFHRRHADRTAQLWLQRLKESPANKRLNLVYLANEVVQQSKVRKKLEFLSAFTPIIAEATSVAYKGAVSDIQQKIRRTVEVWRQRQIFDLAVQDDIERRLDDLDKARGGGKKMGLGGSLFSGPSVPKELESVVPLQQALAKAEATSKPAAKSAKEEFERTTDPDAATPTPPVYAHRLSGILRNLANAESAVSETLKARRALILGLEKLLEENRAALAADEADQHELSSHKAAIEAKKREVEDNIMRGLEVVAGPGGGDDDANRPEIESLTPPPVESLTPVNEPPEYIMADVMGEAREPQTSASLIAALEAELTGSAGRPATAGSESATLGGADPRKRIRSPSDDNTIGAQAFKRKSLSSIRNNDEMAAFADDGDAFDGLDEDVKGMLDGV